MTPTIVVVPVRDEIDVTRDFLAAISGEAFDRLVVLDNESAAPTQRLLRAAALVDPRVTVMRRPGGIYELWNAGFDEALGRLDAANVLVTNNDVSLPPGGVAMLAGALRSREDLWVVYPDYDWPWARGPLVRGLRFTEGVLGDGGMFGACFMLAAERIPWTPLVSDPAYEWWFGDNHLAREIKERGGRQARLSGLPVRHENEATARHHPELGSMKMRDRRRWIESQRRRAEPNRPVRRVVPGTRVWSPRGRRRDLDG